VRVVVPWAAGGSTDAVTRIVMHRLGEVLAQAFVVENRPGAAGTIGAAFVAKQPPDGYTLLSTTNSTFVLAPLLYKDLPYDTDKAFAPVMLMTLNPQVITIHPSVPAKSLRDFIEFVRKRPGQLNYSSAGAGTTSHMSTEMLRFVAKLDMVHVPYKGGAPSFQALLSGETALSFVDVITVLPAIKAGRLRALAITSERRFPLLPDVPTVKEAGLADFHTHTSFAMFTPAGVSRDIVARLHADLVKVLQHADTREKLLTQGMEVVGSTPEELVAYMRRETERWARVVREQKIRVE
jgi:tripartite-type tricarboxylate transporter receptor subunit TctC